MNRLDIKTEVLVRLSKGTTTAFYTDEIIEDWINQSHIWAAGLEKWPFSEYMDKSLAFVSDTEEYAYSNAGMKTDSIRLMKIGTESKWTENDEFDKKNIKDYMKYREDYPDGEDKIFSDHKRVVYINPNCVSGTIYAFGQLKPDNFVIGDAGDSKESIFASAAEDEGDEAIIESVLSKAWKKEKKFNVSLEHYKLAKDILKDLWDKVAEEQFGYQTKNRGMFKPFDVIKGTDKGENVLQFNE